MSQTKKSVQFVRKNLLRLAVLVFAVITVFVLAGLYLKSRTYPANDKALSYLSSPNYSVTTSGNVVFSSNTNSEIGAIVYPGGLVDHLAYTGLCSKLMTIVSKCIIVQMPLNLAVLNSNAANQIVSTEQGISKWILIGHSLGGAMAARAISPGSTAKIHALVLLAAYSDVDLSQNSLKTLLAIGKNDRVLNREAYEASRKNLPSGYMELVIPGGNHAGFGDYGPQSGDGLLEITSSEQQNLVIQKIAELIAQTD